MASARSGPFLGIAKADSPFNTLVLAFLVSGLSYLAARVGGVLTLRPQTLCPLWPACALLVSVLLLVPRKIWPVLIPASFAAFVVYDLHARQAFPLQSVYLEEESLHSLIHDLDLFF